VKRHDTEKTMVKNNLHKIQYQFNWEKIIDEYEEFIMECHYARSLEKIVPGSR
jgi:hypothetical protein